MRRSLPSQEPCLSGSPSIPPPLPPYPLVMLLRAAPLSTALCCCPPQDSTVLWEVADAHVMDVALRLHHRCIRRLLVAHNGYESATEGVRGEGGAGWGCRVLA